MKSVSHRLAIKLDSIGVGASVLCAVHCALFPFFLVLLSYYGMKEVTGPLFEVVFVLTSVLIGIFTFTHGYKNHHRRLLPVILFCSGLGLILISHYFLDSHGHDEANVHEITPGFVLSPLGAILIAAAHYINRRLSKRVNAHQCCDEQLADTHGIVAKEHASATVSCRRSS